VSPTKRDNLLSIIKQQTYLEQSMQSLSKVHSSIDQQMQNDTGIHFNRLNRYGEQQMQSTLPHSLHNNHMMNEFTNTKIPSNS
jgi:polyhydroxyalkanoate synthesis regulator protein